MYVYQYIYIYWGWINRFAEATRPRPPASGPCVFGAELVECLRDDFTFQKRPQSQASRIAGSNPSLLVQVHRVWSPPSQVKNSCYPICLGAVVCAQKLTVLRQVATYLAPHHRSFHNPFSSKIPFWATKSLAEVKGRCFREPEWCYFTTCASAAGG